MSSLHYSGSYGGSDYAKVAEGMPAKEEWESAWGGSLVCTTQVLTEAAIMQRLRRACQRRKNGKVPGAEDALTMYRDTDKRLELARNLIDAKFDKDGLCVNCM